jgi:UDP-N-acetylglucosamine 2-epimerase (non-hydrolysing)/GDP/UDP-N,N'-diacetylbacillosamine 2-epimerase (hydrolysing)
MKRKITVTTGTRSEFGLLRSVLEEISNSKNLELFVLVAGMHLSKKYGSTIKEITKAGFKIHGTIPMVPKHDTNYDMSVSLGRGIIEFSKLFKKIKPDLNLVLGDRDESLASSLAAYHMNIPNAHIHGGDKTQAGIDEYARHAITKISNLHFAATKKSKNRIIRMGENPKFVFHTGSPGVDDIINNKITTKKNLEKKYNIKFTGKEIIVLQHPVTTQSEKTQNEILSTLKAVSKIKQTTIVIAPNSDAGNETIFQNMEYFSKKFSFIKIFRSVPRADFLGLLKNCGVLVGNSSSGIIEASYFQIPVINIGIRQNDRERGKNIVNIPEFSTKLIYSTINKSLKSTPKKYIVKNQIYGSTIASKKIVKILEKTNLNKELIQKQITY